MNARNQHAASVSEQRQIHRRTSYRRKSTVDGKNSQYNAATEHACYMPEGATLVTWEIQLCSYKYMNKCMYNKHEYIH